MHNLKPDQVNDLEILRQSNNSLQRQKLITGIFDRRMRQLGKLDSKQQILNECQKILIQKVLDYMNQLDAADIKYLQQTEVYTQRIINKENTIIGLQKVLDNCKNEIRLKSDQIERQIKEVSTCRLKINHLQSENDSLLIELKKDQQLLRENQLQLKKHEQTIFKLINQNKTLQQQTLYLNDQLQDRTYEINQLNKRIKHEGLKYWNENCDKDEEIENIKREHFKQIGMKEKQISTLTKKMSQLELTQTTFFEVMSNIKSKNEKEFVVEKMDDIVVSLDNDSIMKIQMNHELQKQRQRQKERERERQQHRQQFRQQYKEQLKQRERERQRQKERSMSAKAQLIQSHHFQNLIAPKGYELNQYKYLQQHNKFISIPTLNCQNTPPVLISSPMKRLTKQQKHLWKDDQGNDKKNKDKDKQKQNWKVQFKKQFINTFSELYKISVDIKKIANERINLAVTQKNQTEDLLAERPSREEDIVKIKSLIDENQALIIKLQQSQERAESAYEAMRVCKQELKRRIDNTPLQISNSPQGRLHHKQPNSNSNVNLNPNPKVQSTTASHRPNTPTVRKSSSISKVNSNSNLTVKRKYKRMTDDSRNQNSLIYNIKQVIGGNNLNLNTYIKRSNSSFSLTRDERRRDLKSALP